MLTLDIAARVTTGKSFPDGSPCEQGSAIIICEEDSGPLTIRPRLEAAGADPKKALVADCQLNENRGRKEFRGFTLSDTSALWDAYGSVADLKLVVVDPIGSFLGKADAYRDTEVRQALAPLVKFAEETNVAVLLVAHSRKNNEGSADNGVLGSTGFVGVARSVWHVLSDPDDPDRRLWLPGKFNLGERPQGLAFSIVEGGRVAWESEPITELVDDVLARHRQRQRANAGPSPKVQQAIQFLESLLARGAMPVSGIQDRAELAGISWASVRRASERLRIAKSKRVDADGAAQSFWELPSAGGEQLAQQLAQVSLGGEQVEQVEQLGFSSEEKDICSSKLSSPGNLLNLLKDTREDEQVGIAPPKDEPNHQAPSEKSRARGDAQASAPAVTRIERTGRTWHDVPQKYRSWTTDRVIERCRERGAPLRPTSDGAIEAAGDLQAIDADLVLAVEAHIDAIMLELQHPERPF
jgi:hypothetical protein